MRQWTGPASSTLVHVPACVHWIGTRLIMLDRLAAKGASFDPPRCQALLSGLCLQPPFLSQPQGAWDKLATDRLVLHG